MTKINVVLKAKLRGNSGTVVELDFPFEEEDYEVVMEKIGEVGTERYVVVEWKDIYNMFRGYDLYQDLDSINSATVSARAYLNYNKDMGLARNSFIREFVLGYGLGLWDSEGDVIDMVEHKDDIIKALEDSVFDMQVELHELTEKYGDGENPSQVYYKRMSLIERISGTKVLIENIRGDE